MGTERGGASPPADLDLAVVVPTLDAAYDVRELVTQLNAALAAWAPERAELVFVDDSTDDTVRRIAEAAATSHLPVRLLHRDPPGGAGAAGAVAAALAATDAPRVVVMDGDLRHPPALVPVLGAALDHADLAVAARRRAAGDGWSGRAVSASANALAGACFPRRVGRVCTDPTTGFFAVRRDAVELARLRPRGASILLEIMARHDLEVVEIAFTPGKRRGGEGSAAWRTGAAFLRQLVSLRLGRMSRFAVVGALGTVMNLVIMALLMSLGSHYLLAAVVAAEVTIVQNFVLQELWVFRDLREGSRSLLARAVSSFAYNNADMALRLPVLYALVHYLSVAPVAAQAVTLGVAFLARFVFTSLFVYRRAGRPPEPSAALPVELGVLLNR